MGPRGLLLVVWKVDATCDLGTGFALDFSLLSLFLFLYFILILIFMSIILGEMVLIAIMRGEFVYCDWLRIEIECAIKFFKF